MILSRGKIDFLNSFYPPDNRPRPCYALNACPATRAESFFKTLKRELETLDGKHTAGEVRQSVFMYIEAYYNRIRMHPVLGYAAPDVFNCGQIA
jgi:hypothetical protein